MHQLSPSPIDLATALEQFEEKVPPPLQWRTWPAEPAAAAVVDPDGPLLKGQKASLTDRLVVSLGVGAVGGRAAVQLVRLGIGCQVVVDPDRFGDFSWKTQVCEPGHAGQVKAWVIGDMMHRVHPGTRIHAGFGMAQDVPLTLLRKADVLLAAGDNIEMLVWLGNVAAALGKPLLQGAVYGERLTAIVRAYDLRDAASACPGCALNSRAWGGLKARKGCDAARDIRNGEPTRTTPHLCSLAGDLLTGEALKWLDGREAQALKSEQLDYCMVNHKAYRTQLTRSEACRCPHERWQWQDLPTGVADAPLGEVVARALGAEARHNPLLQVRAEASWCAKARCWRCGRVSEVARFARPGTEVGRCACGQALRAAAAGAPSLVPAADLNVAFAKPLRDLGLDDGASLGLSEGNGWTYLALPGDPLTAGQR